MFTSLVNVIKALIESIKAHSVTLDRNTGALETQAVACIKLKDSVDAHRLALEAHTSEEGVSVTYLGGMISDLNKELAKFSKALGGTDNGDPEPQPTTLTFLGARFMYVVKATHPDTRYVVTLPTEARDAEGNPVTIDASRLSVSVESDNPGAVEILPDDDGNPIEGLIRIGGPGAGGATAIANVNALIRYDDQVIASFGAQFTVVPGDVDVFAGGDISFPDLEEVPAPEDEEPPVEDEEDEPELDDEPDDEEGL